MTYASILDINISKLVNINYQIIKQITTKATYIDCYSL